MKYTTKTEYGLICLVYMASRNSQAPITIKELAQEEKYSQTYIEKILQSLRAARIVHSHQGKQGGYVLARKPSAITLKEIIEALEGSTFDVFCEPEARDQIVCTHLCLCGVKPIWKKTRHMLDEFYDGITLEQIASKTILQNV